VRPSICTFNGVVIKGKQVGRTIGFPTANLSIQSFFPSLLLGVYGVKVIWGSKLYYGVMNVGNRPTFDDGLHVSHEVHLLDFDKNLYDEELAIEVCFYVRQEKKFLNIQELKLQIYKDVAHVKRQFAMISNELKDNLEAGLVRGDKHKYISLS
jgi:riboflavin kinase